MAKQQKSDKVSPDTEFSALVTLITSMETRFIDHTNKIELKASQGRKVLHDEVRETNAGVKKINGRLRAVEVKTVQIETNCKGRKEVVDDHISQSAPVNAAARIISAIAHNPKLSIFLFVGGVIGLQIFVLAAFENDWIAGLIKLIKP